MIQVATLLRHETIPEQCPLIPSIDQPRSKKSQDRLDLAASQTERRLNFGDFQLLGALDTRALVDELQLLAGMPWWIAVGPCKFRIRYSWTLVTESSHSDRYSRPAGTNRPDEHESTTRALSSGSIVPSETGPIDILFQIIYG